MKNSIVSVANQATNFNPSLFVSFAGFNDDQTGGNFSSDTKTETTATSNKPFEMPANGILKTFRNGRKLRLAGGSLPYMPDKDGAEGQGTYNGILRPGGETGTEDTFTYQANLEDLKIPKANIDLKQRFVNLSQAVAEFSEDGTEVRVKIGKGTTVKVRYRAAVILDTKTGQSRNQAWVEIIG